MQRYKNWIKSKLREGKVRLTRQREVLIDHLIYQDTPLSAEEIYEGLKSKNISLTTIYRNLELLKKIGVVEELTFYGGEFKYIANCSSGHWHYVVCVECGFTRQIRPCPLEVSVIKENIADFKITAHRWEVYGVCQSCQEKIGDDFCY